MRHKSIGALLRLLTNALAESGLPEPVKARVPAALERALNQYREDPGNRDGRGLRHELKLGVLKTLGQLVRAVGHADHHQDANVRRVAAKTIRSIQHSRFSQIQQHASHFIPVMADAGRSRNEQERMKRRRRHSVGRSLSLVELNSVPQLRSAGRELALCVARNDALGRDYHHALRDVDSAFWRLEREGSAVALLQLDLETRQVEDIKGRDNSPIKLRRDEALGILRALRANADDIDEFARVGAFEVFVDGVPAPYRVVFGGVTYRIWCFPERRMIVVSTWKLMRSKTKKRAGSRARSRRLPRLKQAWTLFTWSPGRRRGGTSLSNWSENGRSAGGLRVGELLDLCLRCPEVAAAIRRAFG